MCCSACVLTCQATAGQGQADAGLVVVACVCVVLDVVILMDAMLLAATELRCTCVYGCVMSEH